MEHFNVFLFLSATGKIVDKICKAPYIGLTVTFSIQFDKTQGSDFHLTQIPDELQNFKTQQHSGSRHEI